MLWNKKDIEKIRKERYENVFLELVNLENNTYIDDYKKYENIYNKIKMHYLKKIESKEIDISIEKIRLEDSLGKYNSAATVAGINFSLATICAFIPLYLDKLVFSNPRYSFIVKFLAFMLVGFFIFRAFNKELSKEKPKDVFSNICLKVLEDIEKELKLKSNIAFDEVATTADDIIEKGIVSKRNNKGMGWILNIMPIIKIRKK